MQTPQVKTASVKLKEIESFIKHQLKKYDKTSPEYGLLRELQAAINRV